MTALAKRLGELRESVPWRHYERARASVLRMQELLAERGGEAPSAYWREELSGFEYLLDASPLVVEKLRHHMFHVTGLRVYDYRSGADKRRRALAAKLEALVGAAGGPELLVPESPALGGFGHEIDGALYNVDTLKFFEALIALRRAGVLDPLRAAGPRRLAWEIGAGWGGFAYQLKMVAPNTTYLVVDLPELFLFSGTYLPTVLPEAKVRFWQGETDQELFDGWEELDVIFVPAGALDVVRPPRLDLTLNMVSFQEMTDEQVAAYAEHAWAQGSPVLYSLNRDRSNYNTELSSVRELLASRFALEEVEVLDVQYTSMLPKVHRPKGRVAALAARARWAGARRLAPAGNPYRHVVGRLVD